MILPFLLVLSAVPQTPEKTTPAVPHSSDGELGASIDALAREAVEKDGVPGLSILVGRDGVVLYSKGYGYADAKRGEPATAETSYSIGSLTRVPLVAAALQLVEAKKLALDAELSTVLPGFPVQGNKVTIRQLLTRTSGIAMPPALAAPKRPPASAKAIEADTKKDARKDDAREDEKKKEEKPPPDVPPQLARDACAAPAPAPTMAPVSAPRNSTPRIWTNAPLDADANGAIGFAPSAQDPEKPVQRPKPAAKPETPAPKGSTGSTEASEEETADEDELPDDPAARTAEIAAVVKLFADVPFAFAPGTAYSEDGGDHLVLALVVAHVSGESTSAYLRKHLLEPLELADTSPCPRGRGTRGFADDCLAPAEERVAELPGLARPIDALRPLCSTVADQFAWQQAIHARKFLDEDSTRILLDATSDRGPDERDAESLAKPRENGPWRFESRSGEVSGFKGRVVHYPDARLTIVVLANCATAPVERIEAAIARDALGLLPPEVEPGDLDLGPDDVARYAGLYQIATTQVRIRERDGKLWFEAPTQPAIRLAYQGKHFFLAADDRDLRITFQVEGDAPAESFTLMRSGLMSTAKRME